MRGLRGEKQPFDDLKRKCRKASKHCPHLHGTRIARDHDQLHDREHDERTHGDHVPSQRRTRVHTNDHGKRIANRTQIGQDRHASSAYTSKPACARDTCQWLKLLFPRKDDRARNELRTCAEAYQKGKNGDHKAPKEYVGHVRSS